MKDVKFHEGKGRISLPELGWRIHRMTPAYSPLRCIHSHCYFLDGCKILRCEIASIKLLAVALFLPGIEDSQDHGGIEAQALCQCLHGFAFALWRRFPEGD